MKHIYLIAGLIIFSLSAHAQIGKHVSDTLPQPYATKSVKNFSKVVGWENGETPKAPSGFVVTKFADGLDNPRKMLILPNGDILVAEASTLKTEAMVAGAAVIGAGKAENKSPSANRITLLRDTKGTGKPDMQTVFLDGLNQPFGMLLIGNWLYIANTNSLLRYPYRTGMTKMDMKGEKILDLPAGKHNRHWTRNLLTNADHSKIYIALGSGTDHAEEGFGNEINRADIIEINPDGSEMKIYASGLRNPVGIGWAPGTTTLYAAVNERDELGENLVPDYFTSVQRDGFYGWPYCYWGQHQDPRVKEMKTELVKKAIIPDVSLGDHTAPIGMTFYTGKSFPAKYRNGAFIAEHGSWNRTILNGYKVVFVPFSNGRPTGKWEDFLTGFVADLDKDKVHGRPTDVVEMPDGSLLISDDVTNTIWKVSAQ